MRPFFFVPSLLLALFLATYADAMTFRGEGNGGNCSGCEWIVADGEITAETPKQFVKFLADKNYNVTIYLNSPGGDLMAGIKLGELIREKGFSTGVGTSVPEPINPMFRRIAGGKCVSACAYAFLGGVSRDGNSGVIGVHQFYNEATIKDPSGKLFDAIDLSRNQLISALVIDYVFRMGVDPRVVSIASATLPGDIRYFSKTELDEFMVNWSPDSFEPWSIEPSGLGIVAYSKTRDKKETVTFFCRRDKIPRILITAPIFRDASKLQEAINALEDGPQALGMKLPKEAASVRMVNGAPALEIQLARLELLTLHTVKELGVSGVIPRVNAPYFFHPVSTKNAAASLRVAARNCL
jgi:hypothetical protein